MSFELRKFDFCIYENKCTDQLGEGGNCAVTSRVGDRGSGTPSSIFKVLLCNVSSF